MFLNVLMLIKQVRLWSVLLLYGMLLLIAWKVPKYVFPGSNTGKYGPEKTLYCDTFYPGIDISLDKRFKFQSIVYRSYPDVSVLYFGINNIAILNIHDVDYSYIIFEIKKHETLHTFKNPDFSEKIRSFLGVKNFDSFFLIIRMNDKKSYYEQNIYEMISNNKKLL